MTPSKIGFLGCGKLGKSILRGIKASKNSEASNNIDSLISSLAVSVTRDSSKADLLQEFASDLKLTVEINNNKVIAESDLVVLAMKPHQIESALANVLRDNRPRTWVSLAAGFSLEKLTKLVPSGDTVVRAMPNTSAAFNSSMTLLFSEQKESPAVSRLFKTVGEILWLRNEALIDALTPLTASSPAFFYLVCEGFEEYLSTLDLDASERSQIIGQTIQGVGRKILKDPRPFHELLSEVATPGGMTLEGLRTLNEFEVRDAFKTALQSAYDRSKTLAKGNG